MSVTKTISSTMGSQAPSGGDTMGSQAPHGGKSEAIILLDSLRIKQRLLATLEVEGLIHHNRHQKLGEELAKTIEELEILIPQLK